MAASKVLIGLFRIKCIYRSTYFFKDMRRAAEPTLECNIKKYFCSLLQNTSEHYNYYNFYYIISEILFISLLTY